MRCGEKPCLARVYKLPSRGSGKSELLIMCMELHFRAAVPLVREPLTIVQSTIYQIHRRWLTGCNSLCACAFRGKMGVPLDDTVRRHRYHHRSPD